MKPFTKQRLLLDFCLDWFVTVQTGIILQADTTISQGLIKHVHMINETQHTATKSFPFPRTDERVINRDMKLKSELVHNYKPVQFLHFQKQKKSLMICSESFAKFIWFISSSQRSLWCARRERWKHWPTIKIYTHFKFSWLIS